MHLRAQKWIGRRLAGGWLALLLSLGWLAPGARAQETNSSSFRVAFTSALFTEVNENDARAAVRVWARVIATENAITPDQDAKILKDVPAVLKALQEESVDAVGMTIPEYAQVYNKVRLGPLLTTSNAGHYLEQYLLLVHRDSPVSSLADLQGKSLNQQYSARLCLAPPWLDLELVQAGLKPANEFFGKVSQSAKLSQTLLPVFFRQADACVVSRSGFDTMAELNPQLRKQLKVLASSPELVTTVLAFRENYHPSFKAQLMADLNSLHDTPTGSQLLNIFQSDRLGEQPPEFYAKTLQLLETYARVVAKTHTAALGSNSLAHTTARLEPR